MESYINLLASYFTIVSAISASRFNLLMSWCNSNEKHKALIFFFKNSYCPDVERLGSNCFLYV